MPPAAARSRMANDVGSSHWSPKVMVPRQRRETGRPVRPSWTWRMGPESKGDVRAEQEAASPQHYGYQSKGVKRRNTVTRREGVTVTRTSVQGYLAAQRGRYDLVAQGRRPEASDGRLPLGAEPYNTARPHHDYRTLGRAPLPAFTDGLSVA